jgi:molecular chaperone GrpE
MRDEKETQATESEDQGSPQGEARDQAPDEGWPAGDDVPLEDGVDEVVSEVDELREELRALNDRHLRLAAEFDNYRKRNERERGTLATRLQADLVSSLLDVLDDLQRVGDTDVDAGAESVLEGVRLVEKKFRTVLESAGLEPLHAEDSVFDPEVMEALMTVPTGDPDRDGHVADVFQRGYRFRDVLVRPARVRVWQYDGSEGSD